jgi:hypothetical protein
MVLDFDAFGCGAVAIYHVDRKFILEITNIEG